jgi:haloacetate dehalogenase
MLVLWGEYGTVGRCFDPLALWRRRARDVRGRSLPGGHYLAEELPDAVATELAAFLA